MTADQGEHEFVGTRPDPYAHAFVQLRADQAGQVPTSCGTPDGLRRPAETQLRTAVDRHLPKAKAGCWTRWRAFAQVRQGSNIQLLPFPLVTRTEAFSCAASRQAGS